MTLGIEEIISAAQTALTSEETDKSLNTVPVGSIKGRTASLVIMGVSCTLAATAAIVAAVFAFYIAAAIFAVSCLIQVIGTIVASRINVSQDFLVLMKQLTDKILALIQENGSLKNAKQQLEQLQEQTEKQLEELISSDVKSEIEKLKQENQMLKEEKTKLSHQLEMTAAENEGFKKQQELNKTISLTHDYQHGGIRQSVKEAIDPLILQAGLSGGLRISRSSSQNSKQTGNAN